MKKSSLTENINYSEDRPAVELLFESEATKEIRILLKKGQLMKEHKTSFPIVVEVYQGDIEFGVMGEIQRLTSGDIISLESNVPHDLKSNVDSIIRLSLSKLDSTDRVKNLVKNQ